MPLFFNEDSIPSKLGESTICSKCESKNCRKVNDQGEHKCYKGLSFYTYTIKETKLTFYGLLGEKAEHTNKFIKKLSKGRGYPKVAADRWVAQLEEFANAIDIQIEKEKSEVLHYFHDAIKWATQINISAEKLVERNLGQSFSEKLEGSSSEIKSLYQATNMLVDSFKLTSIYFNPDSATYGSITNCEIYKLFDKVQAIIFNSEGKKYNKRFRLKGKYYGSISVYESFQIIPLCLIQNAVKYSKTTDIEINFEETKDGVDISIVSEGPYLEKNELIDIFDKGVRGKYAHRLHHDGLGIGLYVAKKIAEAHNAEITAASSPQNYDRDGMPMAINTFKLSVPSQGIK